MTLPASVVLVAVHGKITDTVNKMPAAGYVRFRMPQPIIDTIDHEILGSGSWKVDLDVNGEFTLSLPATDTPGFTPVGWAYDLRIYTNVLRVEKQLVQIPHATVGTLELSDLLTL